MSADDKYPAESGRRRFVKGVVGSASLAGVGTGASVAVNTATSSPGAGGGPTQFFAIQNTGGPAPRGMPQIPVEITSGGKIRGVWPDTVEDGVAVTEIGGQRYQSSWFQYCGVQTYAGVKPNADQKNIFQAASNPPYDWQSDIEPGTELSVDMFSDFETFGTGVGKSGRGKAAMATWRSDGVPPSQTMPVQVLRSPIIQDMRKNPGEYEIDDPEWFRASTTESGFIAWLDKCTHFCCVPSFQGLPSSEKFGGENFIYCPCHQSIYDPFSNVQKQFVALPRPEE